MTENRALVWAFIALLIGFAFGVTFEGQQSFNIARDCITGNSFEWTCTK